MKNFTRIINGMKFVIEGEGTQCKVYRTMKSSTVKLEMHKGNFYDCYSYVEITYRMYKKA